VPPPVPPQGTTDELVLETSVAPEPLPVGLGFRVPLILISPWTRGGYVFCEVSDHTSVIQLMEKWTAAIGKPATCPNISAWRRGVCGDLTGALDFEHPAYGLPDLPFVAATVGERPTPPRSRASSRSRPAASARSPRPPRPWAARPATSRW
jgi:phospholipase C